MPIAGQGFDTTLGGGARTLHFPSVAWWGRPGKATFHGAAGDVVYHLTSLSTPFQVLPERGVLPVAPPPPLPAPDGTAPRPTPAVPPPPLPGPTSHRPTTPASF